MEAALREGNFHIYAIKTIDEGRKFWCHTNGNSPRRNEMEINPEKNSVNTPIHHRRPHN